ncbi:hypothetical protein GCM10025868_03450 [Angustibacter aerolatus]|uniref:Primosomal protein N' 3' DNA-binding domain-containing protein n=1 Tax=Angustibacter aerolatus TaxID=1162965 RepID=A0ABQ6JA77_9ACTN|nr:primosome assembly protein PriA [Angustibacter aerolatus]GMA85095.1 hypothetical protein GCM10025868_03450 [Angustibacter aerolatus]
MPGPAAVDPVAEVVVDVGLPHLDRPFEYLVPEPMSDAAVPGARVRVRFGGQDLDGFVVARRAEAEHVGRLAPLRRVVSPEPVLGPGLLALCRAVADRWAGSLPDVLRLAVPPRHAQAEAQHADDPPAEVPSRPGPGAWARYPAGPAFLDRLAGGQAPRAAWTATPSADEPAGDWPAAFATAALTAAASGRGALMVLPDRRDVDRVEQALEGLAPAGAGSRSPPTSARGPGTPPGCGWPGVRCGSSSAPAQPRSRRCTISGWWRAGTTATTCTPSRARPTRTCASLLVLRAEASGAAALLGGFARTAEVQQAARPGMGPAGRGAAFGAAVGGPAGAPDRRGTGARARPRSGQRPAAVARVAHGEAGARGRAGAGAGAASRLRAGGRLPHLPHPGAVPGLPRTARPARRRRRPRVPLVRARGRRPQPAPSAATARCGPSSSVPGAPPRSLGRAFPGVPVRTSGGGSVLGHVPGAPALVVSTPGAEPVAEGGYAAALLLDAWALLDRADLRAGEEALRRWLGAAALVRGSGAGGQVVLVAPAGLPPVEALVRWDPGWHAAREPGPAPRAWASPAATVLTLTGDPEAVRSLRSVTPLEPLDGAVEALGPVPLPASGASGPGRGDPVRRATTNRPCGCCCAPTKGTRRRLVRAVRGGVAVRSARKAAGSVRVQRDPLDLV